ncbi:sortase-associated OmpA-like protein PdsO [Thalassotalea atypica]|uniref:sortase-associated OmpA-like protein PdsO n=1 Tax=Thalassotalea atypica TaxID=2054316 RepID=UPI0025735C35|nr:sortase-associated OmpA-like protein PdsO [Thalassotalea atypica]
MKKQLIATAIIATLATSPLSVYANSSQADDKMDPVTKEEIGFGTGALVGAIFGGPAGAFITGIAGNLIAKTMNSEDEINQLQANQELSEMEFEQQVAALRLQLENAEQNHQRELIALEQKQENSNQYALSQLQAENLLMSLQFKTGSAQVPKYYQPQLVALAELLKQSPEITVDLSGYTDLLGDSDTNLALSSKRADSVKTKLAELGIDGQRINTFAFGDSAPVVANAQQESSFYDRRVMIKLHQQPSQVAKNY